MNLFKEKKKWLKKNDHSIIYINIYFLYTYNSVPFIIRGPGIPKNHISDVVTSHTDLAPSILALAKGSQYVPEWVDGGVIPFC